MEKDAAAFILTLLHSSTNAHLLHLSTGSYAIHKTLRHYYKDIIKLTDQFAECYMGRYGQLNIADYGGDYHVATDAIDYLEKVNEFTNQSRSLLPGDSELQNLIDEIQDLINNTLYKLKYLN